MSDQDSKKEKNALLPAPPSERSLIRREAKRMRKVSPLGMRVLVRLEKDANQTDSGLYLPEGAKHNMQESVVAEVLEVATASDQHSEEDTNISGIPLGARVLVPKHAGVRVPWDDQLRIIDTKEVLALIDEIHLV
jgi:co-chaperonin GroES (HSP10)